MNSDFQKLQTGNTIVEFFSAAIEFRVCKYLNCNAAAESAITSAASLSAREALCSPSAAITFEFTKCINFKLKTFLYQIYHNDTFALASLAASASAAIARCSCTGNLTSLIYG